MSDESYTPLCRMVLHKGVIVYNAIFGHRMDMISAHIPRGRVYGGIDLPMGESSVARTLFYTCVRTGAARSNFGTPIKNRNPHLRIPVFWSE